MPTVVDQLPLTETLEPAEQADLASAVAGAYRARTPIYPLGGGTSLDFGLPAKSPGVGISTGALGRVVDYPARDMTITVEAGVTLAKLARTLATERQWLPIEVPAAEQATVGGMVASAWCGPRRFGWGTVRDYVIGVSAVDGCGMPFKGGGRVVKNVAGYDFCKLLTGSHGTLGVITQVTFKIKPLPVRSALVACPLGDWNLAEKLLAGLITSATTPTAIELIAGPAWSDTSAGAGPAQLLVGFDGSEAEVAWQTGQLLAEWNEQGAAGARVLAEAESETLWAALRDFSAAAAPLVLKASLRPSATTGFVQLVQAIDSQASVAAHAGTGVVIARFANFSAGDVSKSLIGRLQPAAVAAGGHAVVLSSGFAGDLTRQAFWGGVDDSHAWMMKVKHQFDPQGLLNPGRFIYGKA